MDRKRQTDRQTDTPDTDACIDDIHTHTQIHTNIHRLQMIQTDRQTDRHKYTHTDDTHTHTHTHTQLWFPRPDYPCHESNNTKASKHM